MVDIVTNNESTKEVKTKQTILEDYPFWLRPPFRLLTDVTQFRKVDPWDLEISELITDFVKQMIEEEDINFPVMGRAILSAAILYRTKVKDLIKIIEENDQEEEDLEALAFEIPHISPSYHISQRPVTFKELVHAFEGLLEQEQRYKRKQILKKKRSLVKPVDIPPKPVRIIDEENTKIAKMKKDLYEKIVKLYNKKQQPINFLDLLPPNTTRINIVRILLCLLFLAFELKAEIKQTKDLGKITVLPLRDNEEEFRKGLEKVIQEKLNRAEKEEEVIKISEISLEQDEGLEEYGYLFEIDEDGESYD